MVLLLRYHCQIFFSHESKDMTLFGGIGSNVMKPTISWLFQTIPFPTKIIVRSRKELWRTSNSPGQAPSRWEPETGRYISLLSMHVHDRQPSLRTYIYVRKKVLKEVLGSVEWKLEAVQIMDRLPWHKDLDACGP